jgi:hypothetical protein
VLGVVEPRARHARNRVVARRGVGQVRHILTKYPSFTLPNTTG